MCVACFPSNVFVSPHEPYNCPELRTSHDLHFRIYNLDACTNHADTDSPADEKSEAARKEAAKEAAKKAPPSRALVGERVLGMLTDKDTKVVLRSISAAGFLLAGDPENATFRESLLEGVY